NSKELNGFFTCYSGKSGDHWIVIIPSLNVSGYGDTEDEAIKDIEYNIKVFCDDLLSLDRIQMNIELKKMGWVKDKYFNKRYSTVFVDENGVLQNFDSPSEVKKCVLETA